MSKDIPIKNGAAAKLEENEVTPGPSDSVG